MGANSRLGAYSNKYGTTSMVVVVMIGDGYGLYDDDHSNDHMIIFYSTKDD